MLRLSSRHNKRALTCHRLMLLINKKSTTSGQERRRGGEEVYERKTPREHILLRPGMYLGQVSPTTSPTWVYNETTRTMEKQMLTYSPALVKVFDEILVNAADNRLRGESMSYIDVNVKYSKKKGLIISVKNDGNSIPVTFNEDENMYTPELIFGHLLTSSNFDDKKKRVTGGRHGYGAKLTNIFSHKFEVEINDIKNNKFYYQKWEDNMNSVSEPEVTDLSLDDKLSKKFNKSYTKITFVPDLKRFSTYYSIPKRKNIDSAATLDEMEKILCRRLIDMSAIVFPVRISYNKKIINITSFEEYAKLFTNVSGDDTPEESLTLEESNVVAEVVNKRWNVAIIKSPSGTFEHMSFVNGVWTANGGSHVNHLTNQCVKFIEDTLEKKYQLKSMPSSVTIRNKLMIFVQCLIENPSFDSQSKDALTTAVSRFGSKCNLTKSFLKKALDGESEEGDGIISMIYQSAKTRERSKMLVAEKGNFGKKSINVPKLEDAHKAGSKHSLDCTLILTEGESAKALARAGLEVIGRDKYGILSLQGKILNVANSSKEILQNKELLNFGQAMGLNFNKTYAEGLKNQGLRYGHILIMTDQDTDGSHIKGLILNFIFHYWPNLLREDGFLQQFHTPLLKVFNVPVASFNNAEAASQAVTLNFYSAPEYEEFRRDFIDKHGLQKWKKLKVKYYKGLGTSTSTEGKEYFSNLDKHVKFFSFGQDSHNAISLAFNKDRVHDRKQWLQESYSEDAFIDPKKNVITYEEFINVDMIQYSYSDLIRSIPSIIDGLKPSHRKVLYSCFKRNLHDEIKVVQLGGSVAEISGYHHGDQALTATIVRMAQDYTGSNNIPLLHPSGQFGTRHEGGKDFASPRYIFTRLSKWARYLFPKEDDSILQYQEEDGKLIEPKHYLPIIPLVLVNGSAGIGTGWSTSVPSFHPLDLIEYVRGNLEGKKQRPRLVPWVRGFNGSIIESGNNSGYKSYGIVKRTSQTVVEILELPCYKWTILYKNFLYKLFEKEDTKVTELKEYHTADGVKFVITAPARLWDSIESADGVGLTQYFKLVSTINIENMHGFNEDTKLTHYPTPEDIIDTYIPVRLAGYVQRKQEQLKSLQAKRELMSSKARFINAIVEGDIRMMGNKSDRFTNDELREYLREQGYPSSAHNEDPISTDKDFAYLLDMPISSLTADRAITLNNKVNELDMELDNVKNMSPELMWLSDLSRFENEIIKDSSYAKR